LVFEYKGIDRSGKKLKGIVQADSIKEALDKLKEQGILVTDIVEKSEKRVSVRTSAGPVSPGRNVAKKEQFSK